MTDPRIERARKVLEEVERGPYRVGYKYQILAANPIKSSFPVILSGCGPKIEGNATAAVLALNTIGAALDLADTQVLYIPDGSWFCEVKGCWGYFDATENEGREHNNNCKYKAFLDTLGEQL